MLQLIYSYDKLNEFINFLPEEKPGEVYYICLRAKKNKNENIAIKDGQVFGTKRICGKRDIIDTIEKYQTSGSYRKSSIELTKNNLSVYITINPRSLLKGFDLLARETVNILTNPRNEIIDPTELAMSCVHRSIASKNFLDFDFDIELTDDIMHSIQKLFNRDPSKYRFLKTKNGFHFLVDCKLVNENLIKFCRDKCDTFGADQMIPVPGCFQNEYLCEFVWA